MRNQSKPSPRDFSRRPVAKRCSVTRRAERRRKSAMLFLAFAFPAALAIG